MDRTERWMIKEYLREVYDMLRKDLAATRIGEMMDAKMALAKIGRLIDRLMKEDGQG